MRGETRKSLLLPFGSSPHEILLFKALLTTITEKGWVGFLRILRALVRWLQDGKQRCPWGFARSS